MTTDFQNQDFQNTLFTNDNLFILYGLNSEIADLIYLDPPFNSKRMYSAPVGSKAAGSSFKDMWTWDDVNEGYLETMIEKYPGMVRFISSIGHTHSKAMMAYITYMAQRIIELHRILKPTGSIYLHCDPTASHYLKIVLDEVFGKGNFRNEIIWHYRTGGSSTRQFAKKHDVILFYSKSENYIYNNIKEKSYTKAKSRKAGIVNYGAGEAEFFEDEEGVYNLVNPVDVWQISYINSQARERTGYPTQKPLALMERIILASSNKGDLVLDPFCGCATTCVASQKLGRKWIGIDIAENSASVLVERLEKEGFMMDEVLKFKKQGEDFIHRKDIPKRTDIKEVSDKNPDIKKQLFKEQEGSCNGCRNEFEMWNLEVDHKIPKAKGGGDYYENYQLLCSSCNRIKGNRPMEYLRMKIKTREKYIKKVEFGE